MPPRREPAAAARTAQPADERFARLVLEELVYERVRVTVDMIELLDFEADLSSSIQRAIGQLEFQPGERPALVADYLERAWARVTGEILGEAYERDQDRD